MYGRLKKYVRMDCQIEERNMVRRQLTKELKKADVVLIVFYLLVSILGALYFTIEGIGVHEEPMEVVISVENQVVERIKLPLAGQREILVDTALGHNVIVVEGKRVHMEHSDCGDQICVHQGEISTPNEMIVCLPNKVLIEIKGVELTEVDQIAQ